MGLRLTDAQCRELGIPLDAKAGSRVQICKPRTSRSKSEGIRVSVSPPEDAMRALIMAHFPQAVAQLKPIPGRRYAVDIGFPDEKVCIECDGYRHHGLSKTGWRRDRAKRNALALLGWVILAYPAKDIASDPERILTEVHQALDARRRQGNHA